MKLARAFNFYLAFLGDFLLGAEFVTLPVKAYLLGSGPFQIGLLGGLSSALYSFMPLSARRIGDRIGSKVPIILFLILLSLHYHGVLPAAVFEHANDRARN